MTLAVLVRADELHAFVAEMAERGCRVHYAGRPGVTCRDQRDSAARALASGKQPDSGSRWGVEPGTATRAWTERVASGEKMCDPCRAADLIQDHG